MTAAVAATVLAGCGGSAGKDGQAQLTLHLGTSGDGAIRQPLVQIAEEEGYYKDYGLKLESTKLANGQTVMYDALSAGKINTTYEEVVSPLVYAARGDDVKLFAGLISGGMVAVARQEDADELSDVRNWKGKNVGVEPLSTCELTTRWTTENKYGFGPNDINYVAIEDYPTIAIGVQKGSVDIGFISSQYAENCDKQGLKVVKFLADIRPGYVCCRQSANGTYFKDHKDAYVAYLKGQIKAYKVMQEKPDEVVALLAKTTGEDETYIRNYIYENDKSGKRVYNPDPNFNGTKETYEELLKQKSIDNPKTLDEIFDISVYAQALKEVIAEDPENETYHKMAAQFLRDNSEYPDFAQNYNEAYFGI